MEFREKNVQCLGPSGLHRMAYTEWGAPDNPRVLICVHGLTRNGRDFDTLAARLAEDYRVICPDVVGRGNSGRLANPALYALPQYMADMVTLIARLNVAHVHWLGTSMGGLIGMLLAAQANSPIQKLILNDVGPSITAASLQRIGAYVGADPQWASFAEALAYIRVICAPFGLLNDEQWLKLAEHSVARGEDGNWRLRYDPAIAEPFRQAFSGPDIDLWPLYAQITCPTLVTRGAESDLLTREVWQAMASHGPRAQLAEFPGVGHAPMFMNDAQIECVRSFLQSA